jgi:hypothetical protein
MAEICERINEHSGYMKAGNFLASGVIIKYLRETL